MPPQRHRCPSKLDKPFLSTAEHEIERMCSINKNKDAKAKGGRGLG
jgi:hypothetical protein